MEFDFNKYVKNNPLLKETNGVGNYVQPKKMFGSPDLDYQSAEDFDLDPQDGENDPLGPDEELMEFEDDWSENHWDDEDDAEEHNAAQKAMLNAQKVYSNLLDHMRNQIKINKLTDNEVEILRKLLFGFFK